jgi:5'-nucleotidase
MRGVSAIISADNHVRLNRPETIQDGDVTIPIVQAGGENDHYLGRLDLTFADIDGVWVLWEYSGRLLSVDGVPPDAEIQRIIDNYWAEMQDQAS